MDVDSEIQSLGGLKEEEEWMWIQKFSLGGLKEQEE